MTATGDFTVSMWIKLASDNTSDKDLFNWSWNGASGANVRIVYEYNGGSRRLRAYRNPQHGFADINGNLGNNTWKHIVLTFTNSANNLKLYVNNGTPAVGNSSGTEYISYANQATFGNTIQYSHTKPLIGLMDEIYIWNRVITADEITELYNSGDGLFYPFSAEAPFISQDVIWFD